SQTIDIPDALKQELRKFRLARRQGIAAYIAKVNKRELVIEEDTRLEDISKDLEELIEGLHLSYKSPRNGLTSVTSELPESSPRFILLAWIYENSDGRKSYPLILINWTPSGSETGLATLHASAFIPFEQLVHANKVGLRSDQVYIAANHGVYQTIEVREGGEALTEAIQTLRI
ncbi:hypothetical protein FRC01_014178, partial [Tulasnella sp. 417]